MADCFRFYLSNLPKYLTPERLRSAAAELLGVRDEAVVVAKKREHCNSGILWVRPTETAGTVSQILSKLNTGKIEGAQVIAVEDRRQPSSRSDSDDRNGREEKAVGDGAEKQKKRRLKGPPKGRSLADQVTSLWRLSYPEQLAVKHDSLQKSLEQLQRLASFSLEPVRPSPLVNGYRNKAEFTFGWSPQLNRPVLGLCLGGFVDGYCAVEPPAGCLHLPEIFVRLAEHTQKYLDGHPELAVWNAISKGGFWRILLVRLHSENQLLVGLQINSNSESAEKANVFDQIAEHFRQFNWDGISIASYHLQKSNVAHTGIDTKQGFVHVSGEPFVSERLRSLTFKVSPLSFFQSNVPATLLLYDMVKECATEGNHGGTLLDLCCGTGTIGLYLADAFERVLGVELVPEAIADAQKNAAANSLSSKVSFICAKVEDVINKVLQEFEGRLTVVLDPPRAGCHPSVIRAVRGCAGIERVVFVACDAQSSSQNMIDLVSDKADGKISGTPFRVTRAVPVDMFPHTPHTELVVQFDR